MTPRSAEQLLPQQMVKNTKTQEIGTVRTNDQFRAVVLIDWFESGLAQHSQQQMAHIQLF